MVEDWMKDSGENQSGLEDISMDSNLNKNKRTSVSLARRECCVLRIRQEELEGPERRALRTPRHVRKTEMTAFGQPWAFLRRSTGLILVVRCPGRRRRGGGTPTHDDALPGYLRRE